MGNNIGLHYFFLIFVKSNALFVSNFSVCLLGSAAFLICGRNMDARRILGTTSKVRGGSNCENVVRIIVIGWSKISHLTKCWSNLSRPTFDQLENAWLNSMLVTNCECSLSFDFPGRQVSSLDSLTLTQLREQYKDVMASEYGMYK